MLRKQAQAFFAWFDERFPVRVKAARRPAKFSLSLEQIAARREAGAAKRELRAAARAGA